jgi:glycerophosphoryl diester phosphodiesterase
VALVIAHRGASACEPENSLAAFRRALEQGADGVELDVRVTLDGRLVVHHDAAVPAGAVAQLPLAEVRRHRLRNGEPVPTLEQALAVITPGAIAFLELKALAPQTDGALLELLDGPPPGRCQVHAFDHRIIRRLTARRPGLAAGVLSTSYPLDPVGPIRAAGASVLWQQHDLVDAPLAALVHQAGCRLHAWTADDPERIRRLLAAGADGICTNRPDVAREAIG